MKPLLLCFLFLFASYSVSAQEDVLDPSIFDGTGKKSDVPETEEVSPPASLPEEAEPEDVEGEAAVEAEPSSIPSGEEPPEEEGEANEGGLASEVEESEEVGAEESPPGIPSGAGSESSRAGQRVESSEKIAPGQAVDYPWDM
jgi:hypothetical protein